MMDYPLCDRYSWIVGFSCIKKFYIKLEMAIAGYYRIVHDGLSFM